MASLGVKQILVAVLISVVLALATILGYLSRQQLEYDVNGQFIGSFTLQTMLEPTSLVTEDSLPDTQFIVNFWASWCEPCRQEHPLLMELKEQGIPIIGVNYVDEREDALKYIEQLGNPYLFIITDDGQGDISFRLGITGVPETLLMGVDRSVERRLRGPLTKQLWEERFALAFAGTSQ